MQTPERHLTAAPRCDQPVGGGGVMSYHCSLEQGHQRVGTPEDPQPCYAVESTPSARAWAAWRERQDERDQAAPSTQSIDCPVCGQASMQVGPQGGMCANPACGAIASFVPEKTDDTTAEQVDDEAVSAPTWKVLEEEGVMPYDEEQRVQLGLARTAPLHEDRDIQQAAQAFRVGGDAAPEPQYAVITAGDRNAGVPVEPSKVREGDQVLPKGGDRPVQDHRIAEEAGRIGLDADIVRGIMEESKRVGISRYGQVLHTFDGRKNIRDLGDELRDALVYVTKLQMTAEADRETLVKVVAEALDNEHPSAGALAEIAVDRILDWVLAQKIGTDEIRPEQ